MGPVLFFTGALIDIACFVWLLVIVFKTDHWSHGLAIIFIPGYALVYTLMNWDEASTPFLGWVVGTLLLFGGAQLTVAG